MTDEPVTAPTPFQLNLVVSDLERSLAFYRALGREPKVTGQHASLTFENGFSVDFDQQKFAEEWNSGAPPMSAGSVVIDLFLGSRDEVDRTWNRLVEAGYAGRQRPYDAFWGSRFAIIADPDGYQIGLMSRRDEEHRSWPPGQAPR